MALIDIGNLIGAHTVIADHHKQRSSDERKREHTREFGVRELRDNDGEHRENHAPRGDAEHIANVVARCAVRRIHLVLVGKRAIFRGTEQAVPPLANSPGKRVIHKYVRHNEVIIPFQRPHGAKSINTWNYKAPPEKLRTGRSGVNKRSPNEIKDEFTPRYLPLRSLELRDR